ncbi:hypothetical protein ACFODL_14420 [Phenylobacterium terrae]|uniref:DUF885 domain-containing protein n=1 Tax=Phenylobacterium terrae TaxID=2665495 RepID=A0ABW4N0V0_9CAUL
MKKLTLLSAVAGSALALSAGAAAAQTWGDRHEELMEMIDEGVREGDLGPAEAERLREELHDIASLEARYSVGGFSSFEARELDRLYDGLTAEVHAEIDMAPARYGWFGGPGWTDSRGTWISIDRRRDQLERRIDRAIDRGRLTPAEAVRLRAEFNRIASLEARYRLGGLSGWERADLDRRFDRLADLIRLEARDGQRLYGFGYGD